MKGMMIALGILVGMGGANFAEASPPVAPAPQVAQASNPFQLASYRRGGYRGVRRYPGAYRRYTGYGWGRGYRGFVGYRGFYWGNPGFRRYGFRRW